MTSLDFKTVKLQTAGSDAPTNAMTVDVEDYFQVSAFEDQFDKQNWDSLECRIPRNIDVILELFQHHQVKATFFTLGWVAKRYPEHMRKIVAAGHEVASHGMSHVRVTQQNQQEFFQDAGDARKLLQDITGQPITGYRAASYSIGSANIWALDVLQELGYDYSSSIYPIRHDTYGMPEAPRFPFRLNDLDLVEIPVTTVAVGNSKLPCGGGGYFRLLPYWISKMAIARVNREDKMPAVFYFHPWEIDPDQPRVNGAGLKSKFRHYVNLKRTQDRLTKLLMDFSWGRMDEVFRVAQ